MDVDAAGTMNDGRLSPPVSLGVRRETSGREAQRARKSANVRFGSKADMRWRRKFANGFANKPRDTARYRASQDRMDVGEMPNQSTRLVTGRHSST